MTTSAPTRNAKNNNNSQRKPERTNDNRQNKPAQKPALTNHRNQMHNNPLATPALQAHLRSLKRAEYATKSREDLSPSHSFPTHLRPVHAIGAPGIGHINTARWTEDDLSRVFSLANSIPFHFSLFDLKITSLFHMYAFLFDGARQATHLMARDTSKLDDLVRGNPQVLANRFAIFAYAVYEKIAQTPDLTAIAQSTTAAFDYYINTRGQNDQSVKRRIYESSIISAVYEEARIAVKKAKPMNLLPFFDLDFQIQLEEVQDPQARHQLALELLEQACAPIREKIKKVEANMKNVANKAAGKKQMSATGNVAGGDLEVPAVDKATDSDEDTSINPLIYTESEAKPAPVISESANTDPSDLFKVGPTDTVVQETVVVIDGFEAPKQVAM